MLHRFIKKWWFKSKNSCPRLPVGDLFSKTDFSRASLEVVKQLQQSGFEAYIVGGGIRDLLLGKHPKDFDVSTNAHPEAIKKIFKRCILVGRRFRLAHVYLYNECIEVSTFRRADRSLKKNGLIVRDNNYGTLEEDALRRDFTINAFYYDPSQHTLLDFVDGFSDLEKKQLKMIQNPKTRYQEDPVRMLRAIRLASKLNLTIEKKTEAPLQAQAVLLKQIPPARLHEEWMKFFTAEHLLNSFEQLRQYQLFFYLFPDTEKALNQYPEFRDFVYRALENIEARAREGKTSSLYFLIAVFLWQPFIEQFKEKIKKREPFSIVFNTVSEEILKKQSMHLMILRRQGDSVKKVWQLQFSLERRPIKQVFNLLENPYFRAGYDFLLLRSESEKSLIPLADWWTAFMKADHGTREKMVFLLEKERPRLKRRGSK